LEKNDGPKQTPKFDVTLNKNSKNNNRDTRCFLTYLKFFLAYANEHNGIALPDVCKLLIHRVNVMK